MMYTHECCLNLMDLPREQAICAIQEALVQLEALTENVDCEHFDNAPAIASLRACLEIAGHMGYADVGDERESALTAEERNRTWL